MSTSLASQLKKLSVPFTDRLLESYRPLSLLFDKKESSVLDRDTFYTIGLTGLEELELLLPEFSRFRSTLFSQSSKFLERSVQTTEVNSSLDKEIKQFLHLITPFIPLKPTLKALEWLINRFNIHLFNADDLMISALPYHDTKIFVRIMQMLDLKTAKSRWQWLSNIQEAGVPLAKLTLYNHCIADVGFLKFICKSAKGYIKCPELHKPGLLRAIFLFYTTTLMGVIEYSKRITENILTAVINYIMNGLKSGAEDYVSSSYIVLACLLPKVLLVSKVLEAIMQAVFKMPHDRDAYKIIKCLAIILDTQISTNVTVIRVKLTNGPLLRTALYELSHQHSVSTIIQILSKGLINAAMKPFISPNEEENYTKDFAVWQRNCETYRKAVEELITSSNLSEPDVLVIIKTVCKKWLIISEKCQRLEMKPLMELPSEIFTQLERRYPVSFDTCLRTVLSSYDSNKRNIISSCLSQSESLDAQDGLGRVLALYHVDSFRRELAIRALDDNLNDTVVDGSLIDAILSRLHDDDPNVVGAVLNVKNIIHFDNVDIIPSLIDIILKRTTNNSWLTVKLTAIDVLHNVMTRNSFSNDSLLSLLPLLFPTSNEELTLTMRIVEKNWLDCCHLFHVIVKGVENEILSLDVIGDISEGHSALVMSCRDEINALESSLKMKLMTVLTQDNQLVLNSSSHFSLIIMPLLLSEIVLLETDCNHKFNMAVVMVEYVINKLQDDDNKFKRTKLNWSAITCIDVPSFLTMLKYSSQVITASHLYSSLIYCLSKIITCLKDVDISVKSSFHFLHTLFLKLLSGVSISTVRDHNPYQILMQLLIKEWFTDVNSWINFLVEVLKNVLNSPPSFQLQMRSLRLLCITLGSTEVYKQEINVNNLLEALPWFLVLCRSSSENIRESSLIFLKLLNAFLVDTSPLKNIIKRLLKSKNEIINDGSVVISTLANMVSKEIKTNHDLALRKNLNVIMNWILDNDMPMYIKDKLTESLEYVSSSVILRKLIPCLDSCLNSDEPLSYHTYSFCCRIIRMFNKSTVEIFSETPSVTEMFIKLMKCCKKPPNSNYPSFQIVAFNQITKAFFKSLPSKTLQKDILNTVINLVVEGMDATSTNIGMDVLKRVLFRGGMICSLLQEVSFSSLFMSSSLKEARTKSNANFSPGSLLAKSNSDISDKEFARKRMTVILEAIQGKQKITKCSCLIPVLFTLLKRCLETNSPSEYEMQLIVAVLLNCSKHLLTVKEDLSQSNFNIELIVQCIRATSNARIHHHCLLFLSVIAQWFPEYVLHNSMAIFAFMGENIFRQDDSHSFKVITETIGSIIPHILENKQSSEQSLEERKKILLTIIHTFVDALPDIPEHRQIPLFQCLLSALGDSDYLWLILASVLQSYVVWDNTKGNDHGVSRNVNKQTIMNFSRNFTTCFSSLEQVSLCLHLSSHVFEVAGNLGKNASGGNELSVHHLSLKQKYHYLLVSVEFMSAVLSSDSFLRKIIDDDVKANEGEKHVYERLMRKILETLHLFHLSSTDGKPATSFDVNFYRLILHRTYELLDKCAALVQLDLFIEVVQSLLREETLSIQSKAIEMLTAKLQKNDEQNVECFRSLIPDLLNIIKMEDEDITIKNVPTLIMNRQLALLAFRFLIRILSSKYPDDFKEILTISMKLSCDKGGNENLRATSLICLAELCHALHAHVIPHLPSILKTVLSILDEINDNVKQTLLLLSSVTVIHRIVERFSHFISSSLSPIVIKICHLSSSVTDSKTSPLLSRLNSIRQNLTKEVPLRVFLPVFENCFHICAKQDVSSLKTLMVLLRDVIRNSADNVTIWQESLLKFFLTVLDYCSSSSCTLDVRMQVEENVMEPVLAFVIKMSEDVFRPFFIRLFDWATREEAPRDRAVVFYFMVDKIADKLKSLFIPFAGHIIKNAAYLLDQNNVSKSETPYFSDDDDEKSVLLLKCILDSMHKCFLYCDEQFLSKDRFDTLVDPLVDQIENENIDEEDYDGLIVSHLAPCIAQFAVAVSNDVIWKTLCYKVLLKSRHSSPKVRYASLQVVQEIAVKLGEGFMMVLPEVVSFFAELMEDESAKVEQLCRSVLLNLESIVGEPLQKYFNS